jgi:hypothetical protein
VITALLLSVVYHQRHDKTSAVAFVQNNNKNYQQIQHTVKEKMEIQNNLRKTVRILSQEIGSRGYLQIDALQKSDEYITSELKRYGYTVSLQPYEYQGRTYNNIYTEIRGDKKPGSILLLGAHYDTVAGTPGADDNASGIAGLLEVARLLRNRSFDRTVRFVAFTLEEPPLFRSTYMGSYVYARSLKEKEENIEGMICLEMIGYFTDKPESQFFPLSLFRWIFPNKGNFISFVSNLQSKDFLKEVKSGFQKGTTLPVESLSTFPFIPGIDFSDHRSFWKFGYKALMITDTAFYRNPHYHGSGDVSETLDYERMAEVVLGLTSAIEELAKR